MGCHFLLQGIFPTQGSNPGLPHYRQTLCCLSHQALPRNIKSLKKKKKSTKKSGWLEQICSYIFSMDNKQVLGLLGLLGPRGGSIRCSYGKVPRVGGARSGQQLPSPTSYVPEACRAQIGPPGEPQLRNCILRNTSWSLFSLSRWASRGQSENEGEPMIHELGILNNTGKKEPSVKTRIPASRLSRDSNHGNVAVKSHKVLFIVLDYQCLLILVTCMVPFYLSIHLT